MSTKALALGALIAAVPVLSAYGHHDFARFNSASEVTLQ
jgi:hypothetical protein